MATTEHRLSRRQALGTGLVGAGALAALMSSCGTGSTEATIPDVVRKYVDAFAKRDVEGCVQSFASDGTYSDPGTPRPLSREGINKLFAALFAGFPNATTETVALDPIAKNRAVWRWILRATNSGSFGGVAPTGRPLVLPGCEFIEVRDGLIRRVEGYYDQLTFLAQLGLAPGQPAATPT